MVSSEISLITWGDLGHESYHSVIPALRAGNPFLCLPYAPHWLWALCGGEHGDISPRHLWVRRHWPSKDTPLEKIGSNTCGEELASELVKGILWGCG